MAVVTWDGSSSTDWNTAANWDTGAVPTSSDDVIIPDTSSINNCELSATGGNPKNVHSLKLEANGTLIGNDIAIRVFGEGDGSSGTTNGYAVDLGGIVSGLLHLTIKTDDTTNLDIIPSSGNVHDLIIDLGDASRVAKIQTGGPTLTGDLTITSGELRTENNALTVAGDISNSATLTGNTSAISSRKLISTGTLNGGNFTVTGVGLGNSIRTIDLGGTVTGNVDITLTGAGNNRTEDLQPATGNLRNVIINNAAAVVRTGRDTTIDGTFTVTAGTLDTENHDLATGSTGHLNGNGTIKTGSGNYSTGGAWSIANTQLQVDGGTFDIGRSNDESMGGNWDCNNVSATIATHKFSPTINMTNGTGLVSGNTAEKIIVTATSLGTANVYGPLQGRINLVTNSSGSKDFVLKEDLTVNGRIVVSGSGEFRTYDSSNTYDLLVDGATQHTSNNGSAYSCLDVIDSAKFLSGSSSVILDAALGSNLCDIGEFNGTDGQAVTGWTAYGNNTIVYDSNSAKITYVDNSTGAFFMLNSTALSESSLTVGKVYKCTFDAKINTGSVNLKWTTQSSSLPFGANSETHAYLLGATSRNENLTNTSYEKRVAYFVAGFTSVYLYVSNMSSGEVVHIDNMTVQEVMANGSGGSAGHKMSYGLDIASTSTACNLGTGFYYSCGTRWGGQNHTKTSGRFCAGSGDSTEYFSGGGNTLSLGTTDIIFLTNSGATSSIGWNIPTTTWDCRGFYFYASSASHFHAYWAHGSGNAPTVNSPSSSTATKIHTYDCDMFILKGKFRTQYPATDKYSVGIVCTGDVRIFDGGELETHQDAYTSGTSCDHTFGNLIIDNGGTYKATSKTTTLTTGGVINGIANSTLGGEGTFTHNNGTLIFDSVLHRIPRGGTFYNVKMTGNQNTGGLYAYSSTLLPQAVMPDGTTHINYMSILGTLDITEGEFRPYNADKVYIHNLVIGDGTGSANSAKFDFSEADTFDGKVFVDNVTIHSDGQLLFGTNDETSATEGSSALNISGSFRNLGGSVDIA